jgi:hypothetical protein
MRRWPVSLIGVDSTSTEPVAACDNWPVLMVLFHTQTFSAGSVSMKLKFTFIQGNVGIVGGVASNATGIFRHWSSRGMSSENENNSH